MKWITKIASRCHKCRKKLDEYKDPLGERLTTCLSCFPLEEYKEFEELNLCIICQYPQFKSTIREFHPKVKGYKIIIYTKREKFRYNVEKNKIITYPKRKEKIIFFTNHGTNDK